MARCPASSSALVTMPTGLVKSMIQASGSRPLPDPRGHVQHDRHRAQRLGEAARPGGLLADAAALQRPGLVPVPGGLAADAQLQQHGAGPVDGRVQVGGPGHGGRMPVPGHDPGGERADHRQPLGVRVDQHQLGDLDVTGQPGDPVDELRGVGGAAADNSEFHHENAFTSAPDWRRGRRHRDRGRAGRAAGLTAWHVSMASGQRQRNRQPGVGSITCGGSPRSVSAPTVSSAFGSGTADSSSWVYGCLGLASTSSTGPGSAIWPGVHDDQPVGDVPGAGDVVGDVQDGHALLVAQLRHQVEQPDPDRHVQHRDRLVGQDQLRPHGQRLGEADPLPLAAAELVRVALQHLGRPGSGRPRRRPARPPAAAARRTARAGAA